MRIFLAKSALAHVLLLSFFIRFYQIKQEIAFVDDFYMLEKIKIPEKCNLNGSLILICNFRASKNQISLFKHGSAAKVITENECFVCIGWKILASEKGDNNIWNETNP